MALSTDSRSRLATFAWMTAVATLGLIALGGLVTSHGAGMAVPDWPTTYGYNMFLFPISQWVGGIFYEHTHRLYASAIGLVTVVLAVWIQIRARTEVRGMARLGWIAVALVVVQGVLGGLRVSLMKDQIGVLHASLAQAFLVLLVLIAVFLSPGWKRWRQEAPAIPSGVAGWALVATGMIFVQLVLGAAMRHQHAGLAVPDFPLAYGQVWPRTDEAFLQGVNALRTDTRDFHPITAFHVQLHMAHRLFGLATAGVVVVAGLGLRRAFGTRSFPGRLGTIWMVLIGLQIGLGASTVWTNKAADVATLHVVVGAACLGVAAWSAALSRVAAGRSRATTDGVPGVRRIPAGSGGGAHLASAA